VAGRVEEIVPTPSRFLTLVGEREHVNRLEWKTRYDESEKLFDENSCAAVSLRMTLSGA
jgi:hypothetical protein